MSVCLHACKRNSLDGLVHFFTLSHVTETHYMNLYIFSLFMYLCKETDQLDLKKISDLKNIIYISYCFNIYVIETHLLDLNLFSKNVLFTFFNFLIASTVCRRNLLAGLVYFLELFFLSHFPIYIFTQQELISLTYKKISDLKKRIDLHFLFSYCFYIDLYTYTVLDGSVILCICLSAVETTFPLSNFKSKLLFGTLMALRKI